MAMDDAQFQASLNAEQRDFFSTTVKTASEAAAAKTKTELEEARRKAVPDKYDVKFADDVPLDPKADRETILAFAKEQGMSNADAQKFADHVQERVKGVVSRQTATVQAARDQWKKDIEADKDLGGAKLPETLKVCKRAMDRFAPADSPMAKMLDETGYGNHPLWVKLMYQIGSAMKEDSPRIGDGAPGGKQPWGSRLFKAKSA